MNDPLIHPIYGEPTIWYPHFIVEEFQHGFTTTTGLNNRKGKWFFIGFKSHYKNHPARKMYRIRGVWFQAPIFVWAGKARKP